MSIDIQYKIKENLLNARYLRENSNWYKKLNRSPIYFKLFEEEMKKNYKLNTEARISKIVDSLDTISRFMDILS